MEKSEGFVYILEVSDIILPVCKIGMTTRSPQERCNEIITVQLVILFGQ